MKRIIINEGKVGLVFKNNNYKRVLTSGKHWLFFNEKVVRYGISNEFFAPIKLEILLQDNKLAEMLEVINVLDNEIVLKYEDNIFASVLKTGKHIFWKDKMNNFTFKKIDLSKIEISNKIDKNTLLKPEIRDYIRVFVVESYEKAILFIDGKKDRILESGVYYFWKNATGIIVEKIDLRRIQLEISGQEMLTKDKTALRINFYAQYKVTDVNKALMDNKNFEKQLYILIQLALREYIGAVSLDELLENKESVTEKVLNSVSKKARNLGVEILDAGIRDIILPGEIKDIMNQVLIAQKKAQANVITRREETASTRSLLNTAKLMEDNIMLFKLKEMEYVEKIADKIGEISVSGSGNVVEQLKTIFTK